eukprot:scaffold52410_cov51-Phaeocystis_antarctica.AAC.4
MITTQGHEEDHAQRPQIRGQPALLLADRLGRQVGQRAAPLHAVGLHALGLVQVLGGRQPEVDEFHLPLLSEQHVLRLNVRVAQPLRVQERQRAAHLLHEPCRLALGEWPHVDQVVQQLAWSGVGLGFG